MNAMEGSGIASTDVMVRSRISARLHVLRHRKASLMNRIRFDSNSSHDYFALKKDVAERSLLILEINKLNTRIRRLLIIYAL